MAGFRDQVLVKHVLHFKLPLAPDAPPPKLRYATEAEIACAQIQWALVAWRRNASLREPLRDAARRAAARAHQAGEDTPRVIALHGLVELADGNVAGARALLESVAAAPDLSPGARFELARLRSDDAKAHLTADGDKFDAVQVASIIAPLPPFLRQPPSNPVVMSLILRTWRRAADKPASADVRQFASCVRLFSRSDGLLSQTTLFCSEQGLDAEAAELAAIGLAAAKTEEVRTTFRQLGERVAHPAGK